MLYERSIASAARTSAPNPIVLDNAGGRGIQVIIDVTAASGTGGLVVIIEGRDPASGKYFKLQADPAALTTTGTRVYEISPWGGAAGGGVTSRAAGMLPPEVRVSVTHGDGSSYTYSVGVILA